MSDAFAGLRSKLRGLSGSQASIETLALYFLHHKDDAKQFVKIWHEELHSIHAKKKLSLIYLANDVIQRSKGGPHYPRAFMPVLGSAFGAACRELSAISSKVDRIINIWEERKVFDKVVLAKLRQRISEIRQGTRPASRASVAKSKGAMMDDFRQAVYGLGESLLEDKQIRQQASELSQDVYDGNILCKVKDRDEGKKMLDKCEEATSIISKFQGCVAAEFEDRSNIVRLLAKFAEQQRAVLRELSRSKREISDNLLKLKSVKDKIPGRKAELDRMATRKRDANSSDYRDRNMHNYDRCSGDSKRHRFQSGRSHQHQQTAFDRGSQRSRSGSRWGDAPVDAPPRPQKNRPTSENANAEACRKFLEATTSSSGRLRPWELSRNR